MIEVLKALSVFFAYAVMAVFAQNAVFTRALGVSRLVKLVDDTTVDSLTFGALLCAVQLISAPLGYFVNLWLAQYPYRMYIRPLVMVLCSTVAFFIVLLVVVVFFRLHGAREIVAVLPMATFNTCILGTLFISPIQSFSLVQTMGFALGSGDGGAAQAAERRGAGHVPRAAHHAAVYRHPGSGHLRLYRPYAGILTAAPAACRGMLPGACAASPGASLRRRPGLFP